jgi:hypothetical protein
MKCCTSELHQTFRFKGANFVGFLRAVVTNVRFFPHSLRLFGDWGMKRPQECLAIQNLSCIRLAQVQKRFCFTTMGSLSHKPLRR